MNNGYYQNPVFPGTPLNNSSIPNQQSVPSYEMRVEFMEEINEWGRNVRKENRGIFR